MTDAIGSIMINHRGTATDPSTGRTDTAVDPLPGGRRILPPVQFGAFCLEPRSGQLYRGGQPIQLTPKAYAVLGYMLEHAGELVTKADLLDAVWPRVYVGDAVVRVVMGELRRALGDDHKTPRFIATIHRRGYRFIGRIDAFPADKLFGSALAAPGSRPLPSASTPPVGSQPSPVSATVTEVARGEDDPIDAQLRYLPIDHVHISLVVNLMREYYTHDRIPFDAGLANSRVRQLLSAPEIGRAWLIERAEEIAGYFVVTFGFGLEHGRTATLDELFLRADFCGRGLGKKTLRFIESQVSAMGVGSIHADMDRANERAAILDVPRV